MKKALTILLAVAMMFCFSATAFAADFNDTGKCSDVAKDAINKVAALGIVEGYEDGGFHPTATITRAEFAKMADIAAGLEDSAKQLEGAASSFSDVKAGAWYTGWINLASAQGYVKGYENGTYGPNNTITYAEVVTVLLRLLGYNDNLTGPWPINYINQANKLGILDDVENFSANAPATRSDVAIMLAAVLDENVVVWDKDIDKFVEDTKKVDGKEETYTLLEDSFGDASGEYVLLGHEVTDQENFEYDVYAVKAENLGDNKDIEEKDIDVFHCDADTAVAGMPVYLLFGHDVTIIADEDDDASYIQDDSDIIEVKEVKMAGSKVKLDGKTYDVDAKLGEVNPFDSDSEDYNETGYAMLNRDGEVRLTGVDGNIGGVLFGAIDVVTDVDTDDEDAYEVTINDVYPFDADADDVIFVKDGERIAATDLKAGDVLVTGFGLFGEQDDDETTDMIVGVESNPSIKGKVTDYAADMVEIDGTEYVVDGSEITFNGDYEVTNDADWKALQKDKAEVAIYMGNNNAVEYVINDNDTVDTNYAILTDVKTSKNNFKDDDEVEVVSLYTADGKVVDFEVASKSSEGSLPVDEVATYRDTIGQGGAVKYDTNKDGELNYINVVKSETQALTLPVIDNKKVDFGVVGDNGQIANHVYRTIASDAIIFNIEEDYEVSMLTKADVLADENITATNIDSDDEASLKYLTVVFNEDKQVEFMAITNFNGTSSVDYAIVEKITGTVVKFVNDSKTYDLGDDVNTRGIAAGDLVTYKVSANEVTEITDLGAPAEDKQKTIATYDADATMITLADDTTVDVADDCIFVTYDVDKAKYTYTTSDKVLKADKVITYTLNTDDEAELIVLID